MKKHLFIKRFLSYFITVALPMLLIFFCILCFQFKSKNTEIQTTVEHSAVAIRDSCALILDNALTQYELLARNPRLSISLRNYVSHKRMEYLDIILTNSIISNFNAMTTTAPYISSVYYYFDDYHAVLNSMNGMVSPIEDFFDTAWVHSFKNRQENEWMEARRLTLHPYRSDISVVSFCRRLNMFRGLIIVNLDAGQLRQIIDTSAQVDKYVLFSEQGECLLQGGVKDFTLSERDVERLSALAQDSGTDMPKQWVKLSVGDSYVKAIRTDNGTYIATLMRKSIYYQTLYSLLLPFLLILSAILIFSLFIAYTITKKNFEQINYFMEIFSDAERGIYHTEQPTFLRDEYNLILTNMVQLFLRNTFLQNQLTLKNQAQQIAELTALQLQINPHFLFNTLQTLDFKSIEQLGPQNSITHIIEALSDLLKYALANPSEMVCLSDEINYLKKYDSIQHYRYENKYILYYELDSALLSFPMMRLILQPLIENSLYHGIKPLNDTGYIKLRIVHRGGELIFSVIDSGVGMSRTELAELKQHILNQDKQHIGVANVNKRLIMRYGPGSALKIYSKKHMGTCVSFRIPYV